MGFTKQRFSLHFSVPLSPQDWINLDASKVRLVMLPLPFADTNTLWELRARNCRVVLRVPESDYYDDRAPVHIKNAVFMAMQACPVDAVIVGVEPDGDYVLSYGSPDWGQSHAYEHRRRFDAVRRALQGVGIRVISPGLKCAVRLTNGQVGRSISEDDPVPAGARDWVMINALPDGEQRFGWDDADGNSVHYYGYNWDGVVDDLRFKWESKLWNVLLHKPLWFGEAGIGSARMTDMERTLACIGMAEHLLSRRDGKQHPLGQRAEFLAPFVANGTPDGHWEPYHLVSDPMAYREIGRWMTA